MELREIVQILDKNKKTFFKFFLIGLVLGIIYFFIFPPKFISTGTLVVSRKFNDSNSDYFTYDGYYNQQAAELFTKTATAILESDSLKKTALQKLGLPINEQNLRNISKKIKIKKPAPQVITLKTNENTSSAVLWNTLAEELIYKSSQINENGDSSIYINKLDDPVVKSEFKPVWFCAIVSAFLTQFIFFVYVIIKGYDD